MIIRVRNIRVIRISRREECDWSVPCQRCCDGISFLSAVFVNLLLLAEPFVRCCSPREKEKYRLRKHRKNDAESYRWVNAIHIYVCV